MSGRVFRFRGVVPFIISFCLYITTLAPGVLPIDAGELAAVQLTGGIAHPTGYPLFTATGFLWSLINPGFLPIFWMNLLAAGWVSLAVFFAFRLFEALIRQSAPQQKNALSNRSVFLLACSGAITLGLGKTIWTQATGVEVYSLHLACLLAVLYYCVAADNTWKSWIPVSIVFGLGMANHLSMVMALPLIVVLYVQKTGIRKSFRVSLLYLLGIGILTAGLLYLWLPLRAAANPAQNWGDPDSWHAFWRHVRGKQYSDWMFAGAEARLANWKTFQRALASEWSFLSLFAIPGIYFLFRRHKWITIGLLASALLCVWMASNYAIKDIDSYFLLAFIGLGIFLMFFLFEANTYMKNISARQIFSLTVMSIPAFIGYSNYEKANQSNTHTYDDYTRTAMESLPQDAILISRNWDVFCSPFLYYQLGEKKRLDLILVEKELIRRSWYLEQVARQFPVLNIPEKDALIQALYPFEHDQPYSGEAIQADFEKYIEQVIVVGMQTGGAFLSPEIVQQELKAQFDVRLPPKTKLVPQRFFYQVVPDSAGYIPLMEKSIPEIRFLAPGPASENQALFQNMVLNVLASPVLDRMYYEISYKKWGEAEQLYQQLTRYSPGMKRPLELISGQNVRKDTLK